ncbi:hypothetical protein SAMD00020551_1171 [Mesobacillus selenatarsenatis SF-1]|uniref:Uncharacterized protein n=1 Tax=Mesobacillus selenatarsenatis (strain DSM 18680 / JCM 14380 / FERM P-15431 / SF-1) TaxID=1321606 RepID=A0A0A8WZ87_MESS1|nr:hypothetical protein SAMD00020551_1171 [Mesobacillus selenatarsenatis SF-1]
MSYGSDSETLKNVVKELFTVLVAIMVWDAFRKTHNDK